MFPWGEDRVRMLLTWSAIDWSAAEISTYCHLKCSANWYASSASTSLFQSRSYFVPIKMTDGGIFFSWWIKCARSTIHWNESKFDISKSNRTISFDLTAFNQLFWKCSVKNVHLSVTEAVCQNRLLILKSPVGMTLALFLSPFGRLNIRFAHLRIVTMLFLYFMSTSNIRPEFMTPQLKPWILRCPKKWLYDLVQGHIKN